MSGRYVLRALARDDLEAIWRYTFEQLGVKQADGYLQVLFDCFDRLADNPLLGGRRDEVKPGYRSFPQGRHMAFYRTVPAGIQVIGLVHQNAGVEMHPAPPL